MADFPDIVEASLRARFVSLDVRAEDVEERFVRGAGAGGQKINKTSSTVVLRHRPTGIEVRCQRERSQALNRGLAWSELLSRFEKQKLRADREREQSTQKNLRRVRQKSARQKKRMIESKAHRARIKSARGRPSLE